MKSSDPVRWLIWGQWFVLWFISVSSINHPVLLFSPWHERSTNTSLSHWLTRVCCLHWRHITSTQRKGIILITRLCSHISSTSQEHDKLSDSSFQLLFLNRLSFFLLYFFLWDSSRTGFWTLFFFLLDALHFASVKGVSISYSTTTSLVRDDTFFFLPTAPGAFTFWLILKSPVSDKFTCVLLKSVHIHVCGTLLSHFFSSVFNPKENVKIHLSVMLERFERLFCFIL